MSQLREDLKSKAIKLIEDNKPGIAIAMLEAVIALSDIDE